MGDASTFAELTALKAHAVAMNALALVGSKRQCITLPVVSETGCEVRSSLHWKYRLLFLRSLTPC